MDLKELWITQEVVNGVEKRSWYAFEESVDIWLDELEAHYPDVTYTARAALVDVPDDRVCYVEGCKWCGTQEGAITCWVNELDFVSAFTDAKCYLAKNSAIAVMEAERDTYGRILACLVYLYSLSVVLFVGFGYALGRYL
jgi:hypothetical protein